MEFYDGVSSLVFVPLRLVMLGRVVQKTSFNDKTGKKELVEVFGHVVGFARNPQDELILRVQWCNGQTYPTHSSQVTLL